ncbi:hypothetical protein JEF38_004862 [Salmonella enterica subsp. enterica serovar Rough O:c:z]|nr:hypothetical protein [Salmonella enterica subsp. enterica serovar Rough O:c:z]
MGIKTGGKLTIHTFGGLGVGGEFDNDAYRRASSAKWLPYDEYIAIECIIAPGSMYQLLTDVGQAASVYAQFRFVNPAYLQGGLRVVREDGSCIDFRSGGKAGVDNLLAASKDIVDADFIHQYEGYSATPYFPKGANDHSGVTIAWGVDLGGRTVESMLKDGVPKNIMDKLSPYVGPRGEKAKDVLNKNKDNLPSLSPDEGALISDIYMKKTIDEIATAYNQDSKSLTFSQIPYNTRTAIVDLAYNYGTNLREATPIFWNDIVSHDWQKAHDELMNFHSKNPDLIKRREKEGGLVHTDIINGMYLK